MHQQFAVGILPNSSFLNYLSVNKQSIQKRNRKLSYPYDHFGLVAAVAGRIEGVSGLFIDNYPIIRRSRKLDSKKRGPFKPFH